MNGSAPPWLLDSYERERQPGGEQVIKNSCAQEELAAAVTADQMAVKELLAEIHDEHPEADRSLAEKVSGLAIACPAEEGAHPLVGHRPPDLELDRSSGPERLFQLLRDGQFALLARRRSVVVLPEASPISALRSVPAAHRKVDYVDKFADQAWCRGKE